MKARIIKTPVEPKFEPFAFEIQIYTKEEVQVLWHRLFITHAELKERAGNDFSCAFPKKDPTPCGVTWSVLDNYMGKHNLKG